LLQHQKNEAPRMSLRTIPLSVDRSSVSAVFQKTKKGRLKVAEFAPSLNLGPEKP